MEEEILSQGFQNEYAQVFLNLINNAKDALVLNRVQNPKIVLSLTRKGEWGFNGAG